MLVPPDAGAFPPVPRGTVPGRIAVIGTDHPHSRAYIQSLRYVGGLDIVTVLEDGGGIEPSDVPGAIVTENLDELFNRPADLTMIFASPAKAEDLLIAAVDRGRHTFCDKPVVRSAEAAERIGQLARSAGLTVTAGYQLRLEPWAREIRRLVRSGELGALRLVRAQLLLPLPELRLGPSYWLYDVRQSGGGVLNWLGCHLIDLISYLFVQAPVAVSGVLRHFSDAAGSTEDLAAWRVELEEDVLIECTTALILTTGSSRPFLDDPSRFTVDVYGSRGSLSFSSAAADHLEMDTAEGSRAGASHTLLSVRGADVPGYGWAGAELVRRSLLEVLSPGSVPGLPSIDDATFVLRVLEAIRLSHDRAGARVLLR